jgi:hypothetical protein
LKNFVDADIPLISFMETFEFFFCKMFRICQLLYSVLSLILFPEGVSFVNAFHYFQGRKNNSIWVHVAFLNLRFLRHFTDFKSHWPSVKCGGKIVTFHFTEFLLKKWIPQIREAKFMILGSKIYFLENQV